MTAPGKQPLDGLRVVWLAGAGPVPLAAMILSDLGADVIRIDRPEPVEITGLPLAHDPRSRGQRAIGVDLRSSKGRQVLARITESADVFVEGMRPGTAERLRIGPDVLRKANPQLIYARMTGWGQDGPLARSAGHDINYLAIAGALHPLGDADRPPTVPLNLVGDFGGGGTYLVIAVLAALTQRGISGTGQVIDCAMVDGVMSLTALFHGMIAFGLWSDDRGANLFDGAAPFYRTYRTADDGFMAVGALEPKFYREFLTGLGLDPEHFPQHDRGAWPTQRERVAEIFGSRDRAYWTAHFVGRDACVTPVLTLSEAPEHEHNIARNAFVEWDGLRQPAPAPRLGAHASQPRHRADASADTDAILADLGYRTEEIQELRRSAAIS